MWLLMNFCPPHVGDNNKDNFENPIVSHNERHRYLFKIDFEKWTQKGSGQIIAAGFPFEEANSTRAMTKVLHFDSSAVYVV